jgi:hypothetical protein
VCVIAHLTVTNDVAPSIVIYITNYFYSTSLSSLDWSELFLLSPNPDQAIEMKLKVIMFLKLPSVQKPTAALIFQFYNFYFIS